MNMLVEIKGKFFRARESTTQGCSDDCYFYHRLTQHEEPCPMEQGRVKAVGYDSICRAINNANNWHGAVAEWYEVVS